MKFRVLRMRNGEFSVSAMSSNFEPCGCFGSKRSVRTSSVSLADFVSASFDDHVKFILDADSETPVKRDYTPRQFDRQAQELTLEFALHGDGPAAEWAAQAQTGQVVAIGGPRGSFVVPVDFDWHLLIGDETALPAIARRLEELPAATRVIAVLRTADLADRRSFATAADLSLHWASSDEDLLNVVKALTLPAGEGYVWCAGEASTAASLRRILVEEKGHDPQAIRAAAYWKKGASAHHQNLETEPMTPAVWQGQARP